MSLQTLVAVTQSGLPGSDFMFHWQPKQQAPTNTTPCTVLTMSHLILRKKVNTNIQ